MRTSRKSRLSPFETELVNLFVDMARWFGAPGTLGEIYGLIFAAAEPVSFEQISAKLDMSTGSVSQGLRLLRSIGTVKTAFVPGERKHYFVVETKFRQLAADFLQSRIERYLAASEERLNRIIESNFPQDSVGTSWGTIQERLEVLLRWHGRARQAVPLVQQMLNV
jgi:DNA-binding transcriptional regulator GbsR (MarR family)